MDQNLRQLCRASMRETLAYYGWQLVVDAEAFLDEVVLELQPRVSQAQSLEQAARAATLNRYSRLWYAACCADGTSLQEQAFIEVQQYAYRLALRLTDHDEYLASESAQETMIEVWKRLKAVREPDAFIKWIKVIAVFKVYRQLRKGMQRGFDETTGATTWQAREVVESDRPAGLSDARDDAPSRLSLTEEMRTRIEATIRQCLHNRSQQEAVIGLLLHGKTHVEVAAQLGVGPQPLSVIKTRALARLRQCEEFVSLIEDLV